MKKFSFQYMRWGIGAFALLLILVCRYIPAWGEWYARTVYPLISSVLSAMVSWIPISMEELVVVVAVALLVGYPFYARRKNVRWKTIFRRELEVLLGIYCWFYLGWGMNYYRRDFFSRSDIKQVEYDSVRFHRFIDEYIGQLNKAFTTASMSVPPNLEDEVKRIYAQVPGRFGLTKPKSWQHPKLVLFNQLYSWVGVLGYMGPFFAESQLNRELLPVQYPFTYAHEYAHLLGVSSEAEANFWAYQVCIRSNRKEVCYSGYFGLLSYVLVNARSVFDDETYQDCLEKIRPEVLEQLENKQDYWSERYSPVVGKIQDMIYSLYLKGNKIPSGQKNYAEVIGMLMALPENWWK